MRGTLVTILMLAGLAAGCAAQVADVGGGGHHPER